jgi:hypothetical protein
MTLLRSPMRGGDDKPRRPHGNTFTTTTAWLAQSTRFYDCGAAVNAQLTMASPSLSRSCSAARPPPPPFPTHTRPSSTRKQTRIPDLNVPASSSRDKRRRPPSLPNMLTGTHSATTQTTCGPFLLLFLLSPTSARKPDVQQFFNLCPSNQTRTQSPKTSKGNKRPQRVLDLNQPPSDSESEGRPLVHPNHIWKRPKEH